MKLKFNILIFILAIMTSYISYSQVILNEDSIYVISKNTKYKKCDSIFIEIKNQSSNLIYLSSIKLQRKSKNNWITDDLNILCVECDSYTTIKSIEIQPFTTKDYSFHPSNFFCGCLKKRNKYKLTVYINYYINDGIDKKLRINKVFELHFKVE